MPKMKLTQAYRFAGQVYGPSYTEAIEVPDEVATAAGYQAEIPVSDPALSGTPADETDGKTDPPPPPKDTKK